MMRSDSLLEDGWRNEEVKEALDLCLACKGCLHECPVRVDMATYKAEFLSHYYDGRLRPRQAYALGLIRWEAQLASRMPGLATSCSTVSRSRRSESSWPAWHQSAHPRVRSDHVQALVRASKRPGR